MSGRTYALEAEGLSKAYRIYGSPLKRIAEALTLGRYLAHHRFWALQDVSFKLRPGAAIGLCGSNGAGKSTLLKVISGTTTPTGGRYRINGRVASMLELGAGFHMDFTGRANIVMNGIMMGLSRKEIDRRTDEIIEFAELGDYIDEPVRTYSSGMGLRLGFAVATSVQPEVLILDEVFAVGDMYFQKKCIDRIFEFRKRNRTILFCSHSLYDLRQLCDEAIWLDHGKCMAHGESVRVTNMYTAFQRENIGAARNRLSSQFEDLPEHEERNSHSKPTIRDARIYRLDSDVEIYEINTGDSIEIRVWWTNPNPEETPVHVGAAFMLQDLTTCAGMGTHLDDLPMLSGGEGCAVLRIPHLRLLAGQYLILVALMDESGVHRYQTFMMPENLVIHSERRDVGLFNVVHDWRFLDLPLAGATGSAAQRKGAGEAR